MPTGFRGRSILVATWRAQNGLTYHYLIYIIAYLLSLTGRLVIFYPYLLIYKLSWCYLNDVVNLVGMKKWRKMIITVTPFIFLVLHDTIAELVTANNLSTTSSTCISSDGCVTEKPMMECHEICGCNRLYKFDDSKGECVIDYEYLKEKTQSKNLMNAERIRENNDKVFQGIIWCVVFFGVCVCLCIASVCVFCCRIHYSDHKLKNEVKAIAAKNNFDYRKKKSSIKKPLKPIEESCNVLVEDANIMCV